MPAPRNLDELKQRTLDQISALKEQRITSTGVLVDDFNRHNW